MHVYVRRLVARMLWNGMPVEAIVHSTGVDFADVRSVMAELGI